MFLKPLKSMEFSVINTKLFLWSMCLSILLCFVGPEVICVLVDNTSRRARSEPSRSQSYCYI